MGLPRPATGHSPYTSDTAGSGDRRALQYPGRLLLVGADGNERGVYANHLLDEGYCVLETQSMTEASRLTRNVWLSAVITQVRLSEGQCGLRLAIQFGRRAAGAHQPAVVLPAEPSAGTVEEAGRSGCDVVLLEPCRPDVLAEITTRFVEGRKQLY